MDFIKFCITEAPFLSLLFVLMIMGGCYAFWYKHSREVKDKNGNKHRKFVFGDEAKNELLQLGIGISLMLGIITYCDGCFKESPNASKDFYEWTGKPRNKTPFGY